MDDHEATMLPAEFARRVGVSRRTVHNWLDEGRLRFVTSMGRRRIPESEVARIGVRSKPAEQ